MGQAFPDTNFAALSSDSTTAANIGTLVEVTMAIIGLHCRRVTVKVLTFGAVYMDARHSDVADGILDDIECDRNKNCIRPVRRTVLPRCLEIQLGHEGPEELDGCIH